MLDATKLPIQNGRARIRPLQPKDAQAFAQGTHDRDVQIYAHLPESSYTPASVQTMIEGQARSGLERGDLAVLAIADPATDEFVGSLVLFDVSDEEAEVGFWMHPQHRGAGLAGAAVDLAARFAMRSGLARLTARTATENTASQRVLARAAFTETHRGPGVAPSGQEVELVHYTRRLAGVPDFPMMTNRLRLRLHESDDASWLHRIYSKPDVARYLLDDPWTEKGATKQVSERLTRTDLDGDSGALALVIEHEDDPIGDVALWLTNGDRRVAEIGWVLDPFHGGRGFATEAVSKMLDVAFDHYRLHRVVAQMDARNTASAKLAGKVGMRQEAHLRKDWWSKGEWTDTLVYGMLTSDRSTGYSE